MYKMLAVDIDDTLLNDELTITGETREALAAAREQGVAIMLATGRMYVSARRIALQLGLNVPIIAYQGALVKNLMDEKVLYERPVPEEVARGVIAWAREAGLHLQVYAGDKLYASADNDKIKAYSKLSGVPYIVQPNIAAMADLPLLKLVVIDDPQRLDRELKPQLEERFGGRAHITKSKPHFLEIMHPEGTKGTALRHLAAAFGCGMEEVIAIGDSWNDHDMIEQAGLGVAMGNAVPALKQAADYVTLSNNEEGVRHVIEKFIFRTA